MLVSKVPIGRAQAQGQRLSATVQHVLLFMSRVRVCHPIFVKLFAPHSCKENWEQGRY